MACALICGCIHGWNFDANAAMTKGKRLASAAILGAGLLAGGASSFPTEVHARGSSGASGLFADAEESMLATIKSYQQAKDEWKSVERMLGAIKQDAVQGKQTTQGILQDASTLGGKLQAVLADQGASAQTIATQITGLQSSTALKYSAAETAAAPDSKARPAYTASLFRQAQAEAAILERVEGILRDYRETETQAQEAARHVAKAAADTQEMIDRLGESEVELVAGEGKLARGVSPALVDRNSENFRELSAAGAGAGAGAGAAQASAQGAKLFTLGVSNVDAALGKSQAALKGLREACGALGDVSLELNRLEAKVNGAVTRNGDWEKTSRLLTGKAGQLVKQTASQLKAVSDLGVKAADRACAASDKRDAQLLKAKKANKPSPLAALRSVQGKLEAAERKAAETEALIRQASQRGAEEAKKFRKFIPAPVRSGAQ